VTMLATALLIAIVSVAAGYPLEMRRAIAIATLALLIDSLHVVLYAMLRGLQRVHYEAIGTIANQLTVTLTGIIFLVIVAGLRFGDETWLIATRGIDTAWLLAPFVIASIVSLGIACYGCMREGIFHDLRTTVRGSWRSLIQMATPFAFTATLARLYTYSDTFLLSLLASEVVVGYYSTPFKIAFAFQFIPLALVGALYPAMSEAAVRDRARLAETFTEGVRVLLLIALPIACGIGVLADRILVEVYGVSFLPSAVPLAILAAAIPFTFANFPAGYLLNAIDRQATNTRLIAIATACSIALNLVLIPKAAAVGAAIAALAATALLTVMNFVVVHRAIAYHVRALARPLLRILFACLAMSSVLIVASELPLGALIALGAATWVTVALLVGAAQPTDLALARSVFRRRTPRDMNNESGNHE
ncbi:polysaccharide biosynthesis C-terminal domain-containing protein, partial [Candidatus Uhrbacteria bacterium]|nr:polysaccharide biosynthesis C-terminal domain-containing protein [Candidatus Uhrbacteria bacterium]